MPAAVGDAGDLLGVDVEQLARAVALVADGRGGPPPVNLAGHAVDVGEAGQAAPGHDASASGARSMDARGSTTRSSTSGGVSLASLRGRPLQSASPSPPQLRRSHLHAVCRLMPVWRAGSALRWDAASREPPLL